jgi:uncharacterized protein (TIGR00369 family)
MVRYGRSGGAKLTTVAEGTPGIGTPYQSWLGLHWKLVDLTTGAVAVEMDIRHDLRGPSGAVEGGVISTLADVAGASALGLTAGLVATEHLAISFLAPGRLGPLRATAIPLRTGVHDGVAEVKVVDIGHDDRLIAVATVTVRVLDGG